MSSQNLIEIQSNLQDPVNVTMQDLIKYANGSNPEVPSYLALMEMNRRKQIEQTAQAFNQPQSQGTIKDQTVNALMNRSQVNPAAAPKMVDPTASQQMVNPTMAAKQVMPGQAPQQVNPAAQPMQAAQGGLMSIPVKHFKQQNFAGGGIVAFNGGGEAQDKYVESPTGLNVLESELPREDRPRPKYKIGNQEIESVRSLEEILKGLPSITPMQGKRPEEMTPEQAYQRQKQIQTLAGVAEDPYADVRARQAAIEKRQEKEYGSNAMDRLMAQAEAFASADPAKGFGIAAAASSKASRMLEGEQVAIRNKQEALNLDIARNMAREEDARRRGDASGVMSAIEKVKRDQIEHDKLQMEYDKLAQAQVKTASDIRSSDLSANKLPLDIYGAETQRQNADTQLLQAQNLAEHQRQTRELAELTKPTAEEITYNRLMARANQDPEIKILAGRLKEFEPGSEEYAQIQAMMYAKLKTIFSKNPDLLPPPPEQTMPLLPKEKPGFFSRMFGGSSSAPPATTMPKGWSVQQNP